MYIQGQLSKHFQRKMLIIVLSISLNMCFGYAKEPSHWDGSFEYPQHMFWVRNKKKNHLGTLIWGPGASRQQLQTVPSFKCSPLQQKIIYMMCTLHFYNIHSLLCLQRQQLGTAHLLKCSPWQQSSLIGLCNDNFTLVCTMAIKKPSCVHTDNNPSLTCALHGHS